jgi:hypothetical protein
LEPTRLEGQVAHEQEKAGRDMFIFQYNHIHFFHGNREQWIMWDEMCQLLQGDALGTQLICLWLF